MSDSILALQKKINSAKEVGSVVRTMKSMAAANISQYEIALLALEEYYRTIQLGVTACATFKNKDLLSTYVSHSLRTSASAKLKKDTAVRVIMLGSDQGLVGQFNANLCDFMIKSLNHRLKDASFWTVGELMKTHLSAVNLTAKRNFVLPTNIHLVTTLVTELLLAVEKQQLSQAQELLVFFNRPKSKTNCVPCMQKLLPLDTQWREQLSFSSWPTQVLPQLINPPQQSLKGLLREYLFVSLYKACTASLASESASRLHAMQRAEKNITQLQEDLYRQYHQQRQSAIDAELFDLLNGFETQA